MFLVPAGGRAVSSDFSVVKKILRMPKAYSEIYATPGLTLRVIKQCLSFRFLAHH